VAITKKQFLALSVGDKLIDAKKRVWTVIDTVKTRWSYDLLCRVSQEIRRIYMLTNSYPGGLNGLILEVTNSANPVKELCQEKSRIEKHQTDEFLPETLTYQEVLELAENFMAASGIRDFCANFCGGGCCAGCNRGPHACHKNEGRRLACSLHVCSKISEVIGSVSMPITRKYRDFCWFINAKVIVCLGKGDPYFTINDPKLMAGFRVAKSYALYYLPDQTTTALIKQQMVIFTHQEIEARKEIERARLSSK